MSRIPNSAMPHAWVQKQAEERKGSRGAASLGIAALAGVTLLGWKLLRSRRGNA
ncbi:MAG: hypothetical protein J7493_04680 [Porphyrobacter sp.]|nr:hypothetical protein [Porphyrobacter sp.]